MKKNDFLYKYNAARLGIDSEILLAGKMGTRTMFDAEVIGAKVHEFKFNSKKHVWPFR